MSIFSSTAPFYWNKGLPAIPLRPNSKRPFMEDWSKYSHQMIPEADQADWLIRFNNNNIGLPMGEQSGLVAVDVDTDDPRVTKMITDLLPPSPWIRKGRKGAVYIYRWAGHKTFRVRTRNGESLLEVLSSGTQIVLPPSIHPDTNMPYTANCNLYDVLDQIPVLPKQAEQILRRALVEQGMELSTKGYTRVTEVISVGARDTKMTAVAGLLARGVMRGELSLAEACSQIRAWVENFTESVAGDSLSPDKGVQKIIEFVAKDIHNHGKMLPTGWDDDLTTEEKAQFHKEFGVDSEHWTAGQVINFISKLFIDYPDGSRQYQERNSGIESALRRVAANENITSMDHDVIFQHINQMTGRQVTVSALRRRLAQLKRGTIQGEHHAEIARLVIDNFGRFGEVRHHHSKFWQWQGSHWEELPMFRILEVIATEYGDMPAARRSSDHFGITRVMAALVEKDLSLSPVRGLNFANGFLTVDLDLKPHDPDYGCTYVLPYTYDPARAGASQRFLSFLYQSWGHNPDYAKKVRSLQEAMAVTLFGLAPSYQKVFCLYGVPHSGKSVLSEIVAGLLPDEAVARVAPHKWNDKFLPTQFDGKLANFCGELSESESIAGDIFKSVVDGEQMSGQYKGRDIFLFRPQCAHWFSSNHLPRTRDASAGFTRRWLFLQFDKAVPKKDRILGLSNDIVAEEQDAIVAWAVSIMPELHQRGSITEPPSHTSLAEEMAGVNNSVRFFMTAGPVRTGRDQETDETALHTEYWQFCRVRGVRPVSLMSFRLRMTELQEPFGFKIQMKHLSGIEQAFYVGLTLVIAP